MAYSITNHIGTGTRTLFSVSFPFIRPEHVKATVDGVEVDATVTGTSIQISPAPPLGAEVKIWRNSASDGLFVKFKDGSAITEQELSILSLQMFYIGQEATDRAADALLSANAADAASDDAVAAASGAVTQARAAVDAALSASVKADVALKAAYEYYLPPSSSDYTQDVYGEPLNGGEMYYNTTLKRVRQFAGGEWHSMPWLDDALVVDPGTAEEIVVSVAGSISGTATEGQDLTYNASTFSTPGVTRSASAWLDTVLIATDLQDGDTIRCLPSHTGRSITILETASKEGFTAKSTSFVSSVVARQTAPTGVDTPPAITVGDEYRLKFREPWTDTTAARISPSGGQASGSDAFGWRSSYPWGPDITINSELARFTFSGDTGYFANPSSTPLGFNPFMLTGESVRIASRRANAEQLPHIKGLTWLSGVLACTQMSFKYGYLEFDATCPAGDGFFPGFWTLEKGGVWPTEIDVAEMDGAASKLSQVSLNYHGGDPGSWSDWVNIPEGRLITDRNRYGVEWTPEKIYFYVNGHLLHSCNNYTLVPSYPLVSFAISSGTGKTAGFISAVSESSPDDAYIELFDVQVWQRPSQVAYGPTIDQPPVITTSNGNVTQGVGATLTISYGSSATGNVVESYLRRGNTKIAGTDNATSYVLTSADDEKTITAFRRYENSAGEPAETYSNWVYVSGVADGGVTTPVSDTIIATSFDTDGNTEGFTDNASASGSVAGGAYTIAATGVGYGSTEQTFDVEIGAYYTVNYNGVTLTSGIIGPSVHLGTPSAWDAYGQRVPSGTTFGPMTTNKLHVYMNTDANFAGAQVKFEDFSIVKETGGNGSGTDTSEVESVLVDENVASWTGWTAMRSASLTDDGDGYGRITNTIDDFGFAWKDYTLEIGAKYRVTVTGIAGTGYSHTITLGDSQWDRYGANIPVANLPIIIESAVENRLTVNLNVDGNVTGMYQKFGQVLIEKMVTTTSSDGSGGAYVWTPNAFVSDLTSPNDLVAAGVRSKGYSDTAFGWNADPTYSTDTGYRPAAVVQGVNTQPTQSWLPSQPGSYLTQYPQKHRLLVPWTVIFAGANHTATNVAVWQSNEVFESLYYGGNLWTVEFARNDSGVGFFAASLDNVTSTSDPVQVKDYNGGKIIRIPPNPSISFHTVWNAKSKTLGLDNIEGIYHAADFQLVPWDNTQPFDPENAEVVVHIGNDFYPDGVQNVSGVIPGAGLSRLKRITETKMRHAWANLDVLRSDSTNSPKQASMSTNRFINFPPNDFS